MGGWFNEGATVGWLVSGFVLETQTGGQVRASDPTGNPFLAVPFFNPDAGGEAAYVLANPGVAAGGIAVGTLTRLWGAEANLLYHVFATDYISLGLLGGFTYLDLAENLSVATFTSLAPGGIAQFTTTTDRFATRNQFFGGQVGGRFEGHWNALFGNVTTKVGLGQMNESQTINGNTLMAPNPLLGVTTGTPGGIFTSPTNIGRQTANEFAVVTSVGVQLGVDCNEHLRTYIGYDYLYVNKAIRPGDQIDRRTNPAFAAVGDPNLVPTRQFNISTFWTEGLSAGLELRF
jgi:hypothetical protein